MGKRKTLKNLRDSGEIPVCYNRDCKLRKQRKCKGFQGCPGFKGK